jgi:hypothetical protein
MAIGVIIKATTPLDSVKEMMLIVNVRETLTEPAKQTIVPQTILPLSKLLHNL